MRPEPLRIVYLASTLPRSGPTTQLLNILGHLDRELFRPVVVTLSPDRADSESARFGEIGVPVRSIAMSRARSAFHRGWRRDIERLLGAPLDRCSLVHSQGIRSDVISARELDGVQRVATARNQPCDDYPMKFGPLLGRWMARTHLRAFRALPNVVACSSDLAEALAGHGVTATVIRNGVDTRRFHPAAADEKHVLRAELGLPGRARVGVCVGALSVRKDPLAVVRAAKAAGTDDLALVFVGSGPLEQACRTAADGDPRIRFAGEVDDADRWLRAADFFVSASRSEGLPNAALEAAACGLPLVLSDIGPHRELSGIADRQVELFTPGRDADLAAAIGRAAAADHPVAHVAQIAERVGAERMSRQYQDLYLSLVESCDAVQPA